MRQASLLLLFVLLFSACQTEAEKRAAERVRDLDAYLEDHRSGVEQFFESLAAAHASVTEIEPVDNPDKLSAADTTIYNSMRVYQVAWTETGEPLPTPDPVDMNTNTVTLLYDGGTWDETWVKTIQTIKLDRDNQRYYKINDRINGEDWPDDITGSDDYPSEESRLEMVDELKAAIDHISSCRYIIVLQPLMIRPATIVDDGFESGELFGTVSLFDVRKKEFTHRVWTKNDNSMMVWGTGYGKEPDMGVALTEDLRQEMSMLVRNRTDEMFLNARPKE